jgi:hypothetical protein
MSSFSFGEGGLGDRRLFVVMQSGHFSEVGRMIKCAGSGHGKASLFLGVASFSDIGTIEQTPHLRLQAMGHA